ncbi:MULTISPECIES: ABC transporter permease [unclassified Variovorax]|uniref:ABC transporter permease n=1 Tax=unclassified Variovorax TaxID=663243 RepID=UPI002B225AB9|nr:MULTISPECIES: ABC transporter permease [unclassified Variovorax]MEB0057547.1 ABC transporter permease [Variovorax sp. LG9.2]MEB0109829.1 ABC transporter permease [Variovorax sp. RTB1]
MSTPADSLAGLTAPRRIASRWRAIAAAIVAVPPAYPGTVILLLLAAFMRPQLLSLTLLPLIVRQAAPLGLAVIGQSLVMRSRSIDLSSGGVIVAVSYILTSGFFQVPDAVAMAMCVVLGLGVGTINGILIVRARASSMIVTLSVAMILLGVVIALSQFRAPGEAPESLRALARMRLSGLPVPVLVWLALLVPAALFLRTTVFGRYLDAVGANPQAAALSGIPYLRVIFVGHVASALISVLCGFILVGFVGFGSVTLGQELALNSLAAAILGGVNFGNGKGGMVGPAVAAFMLTFLFNFLTSLGLGEPGRLMLQGAIIAGAALIYSIGKR